MSTGPREAIFFESFTSPERSAGLARYANTIFDDRRLRKQGLVVHPLLEGIPNPNVQTFVVGVTREHQATLALIGQGIASDISIERILEDRQHTAEARVAASGIVSALHNFRDIGFGRLGAFVHRYQNGGKIPPHRDPSRSSSLNIEGFAEWYTENDPDTPFFAEPGNAICFPPELEHWVNQTGEGQRLSMTMLDEPDSLIGLDFKGYQTIAQMNQGTVEGVSDAEKLSNTHADGHASDQMQLDLSP